MLSAVQSAKVTASLYREREKKKKKKKKKKEGGEKNIYIFFFKQLSICVKNLASDIRLMYTCIEMQSLARTRIKS